MDAAAALRRNGSWRDLHDDCQVKTTLDRVKAAGSQRMSTASATASRASPTAASSFSPSSPPRCPSRRPCHEQCLAAAPRCRLRSPRGEAREQNLMAATTRRLQWRPIQRLPKISEVRKNSPFFWSFWSLPRNVFQLMKCTLLLTRCAE